jgi:hypothetical protein
MHPDDPSETFRAQTGRPIGDIWKNAIRTIRRDDLEAADRVQQAAEARQGIEARQQANDLL